MQNAVYFRLKSNPFEVNIFENEENECIFFFSFVTWSIIWPSVMYNMHFHLPFHQFESVYSVFLYNLNMVFSTSAGGWHGSSSSDESNRFRLNWICIYQFDFNSFFFIFPCFFHMILNKCKQQNLSASFFFWEEWKKKK